MIDLPDGTLCGTGRVTGDGECMQVAYELYIRWPRAEGILTGESVDKLFWLNGPLFLELDDGQCVSIDVRAPHGTQVCSVTLNLQK